VHGNAKSDVELRRSIEVGVGSIVLDSLAEVGRVAAIASELGRVQPVRLRINSGVHASTHEYLATAHEDQKFGVPLTRAVEVVEAIRSHDSLEFLGLHSHIGSQIFESEGFSAAISRLMGLQARLLRDGPVPQLNLGGGFGIAYTDVDEPRPIEDIANDMAAELASAAASLGIPVPDVALEPGRSIVGPAGVTLYRVEVVKPLEVTVPQPPYDPERDGPSRDGVMATRTYVSVDGGMSDNIRPALYRADYSARIASRVSTAEPILTRVVGKHCEGGDILVHAEYLPGDVERGDLLAVPATGAYGWAMSNNYNWIARPPVVAVRDGVARVIVHGETINDLLRRDAGIDHSRDTGNDHGRDSGIEGSTTS
jgi:diaminopimelate decarboxylase